MHLVVSRLILKQSVNDLAHAIKRLNYSGYNLNMELLFHETKVYNSLYPDHKSTEHNIHAMLNREKYGVVWIGIRSTFALKEWGYERPSKILFNKVTKIVEKKYKETTRPVPFTVIVAEMGKYRQVVKHSSITIASYRNPNLLHINKNSFIPKKKLKSSRKEI